MKYFQILFGIFCLNLSASYEITVLATNISNYGGFGEWSFSALYESDKESILFDTGFHEDTVLHNAKVLNKDLSKVEKVILSHFHSDHTGGLIKLRKTYKPFNKNAFKNVYVTKGFFAQRYTASGDLVGPGNYSDANKFKKDAEGEGITFIILDSHAEIAKDLYATGTVLRTDEYYNGPKGLLVRDGKSNNLVEDIIVDDQSAGMLTNSGWIMMSGCGHSGIINTAKKLEAIANPKLLEITFIKEISKFFPTQKLAQNPNLVMGMIKPTTIGNRQHTIANCIFILSRIYRWKGRV